MTRHEYVQQFPWADSTKGDYICCPFQYGLDKSKCCHDCDACFEKDATINGNAAPFIFAFPVKPGQKVYRVDRFFFGYSMVLDSTIASITFSADGSWTAKDYAMNVIATSATWQKDIFDTREAAEKKMEEMRN